MELSFAKCETILNTLPIGFYTGRRINTTLDEKADTSFYSPAEDKIVVSYPIIAQRCKQISEGIDEEGAVRGMLYHEVSHAILTPSTLRASAPVNIFEDERIESKLRNYYHGVDFRQQLYDICGGYPPKAGDAEQAFFNAVRFGLGNGKIQKEISKVMKRFDNMNRTTPRYDWSRNQGASDYEDAVNHLYQMVQDEFEKDPDSFDPQGQSGEQQQMDKLQNSKGDGESSGNKQEEKRTNGEGETQEEQEVSTRNIAEPRESNEMSMDEVKRMVGASLGKAPELDAEEQTKLDNFQKTVEMIIGNFNKKNRGGSGINAYSGVFNPRAVARQDYRFFERSMSTQGNNKFGTCHLNLVIDCSGSYERNVPLTNGILAVLSEIERKNRNFSMDVIFINHELHRCNTVRDRHMKAWGGNSIPENMKDIMRELQKPQTCNYNIVLFDGDAICNNYDLRTTEQCRKRFGAFDMKQTTLISDPDNEDYMKNFTSTKIVITRNYTEELIKHITNALTIAFA